MNLGFNCIVYIRHMTNMMRVVLVDYDRQTHFYYKIFKFIENFAHKYIAVMCNLIVDSV